jgi:hypothetical protein
MLYSRIFLGVVLLSGASAAWAYDDIQLKLVSVAGRQYEAATRNDSAQMMLSSDVERVVAFRSPHQFKDFRYLGRKDETVTIRVESVQFLPQVFLRLNDETIAEDMNDAATHSLEIKKKLSSDGEYSIRVRAKGAGQGLFHVVVRSVVAGQDK